MKSLSLSIRLLLSLGAVTASSAWGSDLAAILDAGTPVTPTGLLDVALADLDGDGDLDLIGADGSFTLQVSLNDGTGAFVPTSRLAVFENAIDVTCGDLENDGDIDLVVVGLALDVVPPYSTTALLSSALRARTFPLPARRTTSPWRTSPAMGSSTSWSGASKPYNLAHPGSSF